MHYHLTHEFILSPRLLRALPNLVSLSIKFQYQSTIQPITFLPTVTSTIFTVKGYVSTASEGVCGILSLVALRLHLRYYYELTDESVRRVHVSWIEKSAC